MWQQITLHHFSVCRHEFRYRETLINFRNILLFDKVVNYYECIND